MTGTFGDTKHRMRGSLRDFSVLIWRTPGILAASHDQRWARNVRQQAFYFGTGAQCLDMRFIRSQPGLDAHLAQLCDDEIVAPICRRYHRRQPRINQGGQTSGPAEIVQNIALVAFAATNLVYASTDQREPFDSALRSANYFERHPRAHRMAN